MARGLGLPARGVGVVRRLAVALALVVALLMGALLVPAPAAAATLTFTYTGAAQAWVVPAGVTAATFVVYGAQGGTAAGIAGGGGGAVTTQPVPVPRSTVSTSVSGQGGSVGACSNQTTPGAGGFNGGGDGGIDDCEGAGGGGASDVRIGGVTLADRALVAGGGGGGTNGIGGCGPSDGGAGGGLVGLDGNQGGCLADAPGGNQDGTTGSGQLGVGGAGGTFGGGGGGGGYYGGAGGNLGSGGGGGSGFGPVGTVFVTGGRAGDGLVTVTFVSPETRTTARGSATYGDPTATLSATITSDGAPVPAGGAVTFTFDGQTYQGTTNAQGVATVAVPLPPGTNAGTYPNRVQASYAGTDDFDPSSGSGPLVVGRKVLWVKPTDRTVGLRQPNPPTTPPAGCVQQQTPTSACWLELANGSSFVNGDDWADLNLANLRFAYGRTGNGPANEKVGAQYRITALGALGSNYDIRYQTGILRVVAP